MYFKGANLLNTIRSIYDNDEFYFDNDILNDKVHLFFKSNRSVDEYSIRGHQFLNSFELSINTLGIEHDTMLKKLGNIIFARIKQLEKDYAQSAYDNLIRFIAADTDFLLSPGAGALLPLILSEIKNK